MSDQFRLSRLFARVGAVLLLQVAGAGVIVAGTYIAVKTLKYDELDVLIPYFVLIISVELALVLGISVAAVRALRTGRVDMGVGWLIGLWCLVVVPFVLYMLMSTGWM
jgi:hypothetical protein